MILNPAFEFGGLLSRQANFGGCPLFSDAVPNIFDQFYTLRNWEFEALFQYGTHANRINVVYAQNQGFTPAVTA